MWSQPPPPGPRETQPPLARMAGGVLASLAVLSSAGCRYTVEPTADDSTAASQEVAKAVATDERPGEVPLHEMARRHAGFAGFFFEDGIPVVLITDIEQADLARDAFASTQDQFFDRSLGVIGAVEVRPAKYTFAQLAEWRDALAERVFRIDGVVSLDLDERGNRIDVGLADQGSGERVRAQFTALGLPEDAAQTQIRGRFKLDVPTPSNAAAVRWRSDDGTVNDTIRPVVGGLVLWRPGLVVPCTLGFNFMFDTSTTMYALTASHCTPDLWEFDGEDFFQPGSGAANLIGAEAIDPDPDSCGAYRCRKSDAAAIEYGISDHLFGHVVRTTSRHPTQGSVTIDTSKPRMRIKYEALAWTGWTVDKIGRSTGWTYGTVEKTCEDVILDLLIHKCQTIATYGHEVGDSGSPVFIWQDSTVQLVGVHAGHDGEDMAMFSTIGNIEAEFGAIETSYGVFIDGPGGAWTEGTYEWEAMPSPTAGSHSYQWRVQYIATGQWQTLGTAKTQQLYIDANDGHLLLEVTASANFGQTGLSAMHERVISNNIGGGPEQPARDRR